MTNQPNKNQKALIEMDLAQKELAEAYELIHQTKTKISNSYIHVKESNATSINKDCSTYQVLANKLNDQYKSLIMKLNDIIKDFDDPGLMFHKLITNHKQ